MEKTELDRLTREDFVKLQEALFDVNNLIGDLGKEYNGKVNVNGGTITREKEGDNEAGQPVEVQSQG